MRTFLLLRSVNIVNRDETSGSLPSLILDRTNIYCYKRTFPPIPFPFAQTLLPTLLSLIYSSSPSPSERYSNSPGTSASSAPSPSSSMAVRTPTASAAPPAPVEEECPPPLKALSTRSWSVSGAAAGRTVFFTLNARRDLGEEGFVSVTTMTPPVGYVVRSR